jgi:hypothetical protein
MSLYRKIRGTIETIFQLGLGGPQLKNNAGAIEARNSADAAFAIMRGATAVAASDLVPLAQVPGAAGWATALDLDFTAQANQTLSPNGNYTIAGLTWTKINSAGDATAMAIVNGTGLVIQPTASTDINGITYTSPLIRTLLSGFLPANADWTTALRIWVSFGNCNMTSNFDSAVFGVDSGNDSLEYNMKYGFCPTSSNKGFVWAWTYNGVNEQGSSYFAGASDALLVVDSTTRTVVMQMDQIQCREMSECHGAQLAAGAAFPNMNTLTASQSYFYNSGSGTATVAQTGVGFGGLGLMIGAQRAGSGTALSMVVQRIRVDYRL